MLNKFNRLNICDLIPKSTVVRSDIKKLIHKTYHTNRKENYGTICLHGETLSLENVGIGEKEFIPLEKLRFRDCSGHSQKLAEIHTHPSHYLLMSEGDILDSFRRSVDTICIAVETENKEDKISCYTLKNEHKKTRTYVDNLKKDVEHTVKQIRIASDKAFKASYSKDENLRINTYHEEQELRSKYRDKVTELRNLMGNSQNWFDRCDNII